MKHIFAIAVLSIFTVSAHAALPNVPQAALCELSADPETIVQSNLEQTNEIDVRKVTTISPVYLSYINQYLQWREYTTTDLDLAGIQATFDKETPFDELYVISYKVKSSGATFTQILSYPGDNAYSYFFDVAGNLVANSQDGWITLKVGNETVDCESAE